VRAYTRTAAMAVRAAHPVEMVLSESFRIILSYPDFDRFRRQAARMGFSVGDPTFGVDVDVPVLARAGRAGELAALVADCTAGAGLIQPGPLVYVPEPIAQKADDEPEGSR
jgi:hypothetical protein